MFTKCFPHQNKRPGFTLIELLVVISVIAILLSILLPALSKVGVSSRAMKCASHMRTIGQANHTFALDHKGRAPCEADIRSRPSWCPYIWNNILNYEVFGEDFEYPFSYPKMQQHIIRWKNSGSQEYDEDKLFCPELWEDRGIASEGTYIHQRAYAQNSAVKGFNDNFTRFNRLALRTINLQSNHPLYEVYWLGAKFEYFSSPSTTYMHVESQHSGDTMSYQTPAGLYMLSVPENCANARRTSSNRSLFWGFRHNRAANQLFIDGHVERYMFPTAVGQHAPDFLNVQDRFEEGVDRFL